MKKYNLLILLIFSIYASRGQELLDISKVDTSKMIHVTIRNSSSTYSKVEPLYVVDGYRLINKDISEDYLSKIVSTDRIVSINVLKDLESIQKYGDAAKNGVILITTKDAKKCSWRRKLSKLEKEGLLQKEP